MLMKVIYRGDKAVEPVLSEAARFFNVNINILHGKIEYIGGKPIGIFVVDVAGGEFEVTKSISYIAANTAHTEVLHVN